ncbi:Uncharacterised protein [BD1-7 clade bacterium]|uniref:Uncharacterized protein n=1 Tax=BD1-7 clade bacterium TaxID=2029982 RepID=A0A5S9PJ36_9GAMM|nr:Uncharacterised protein [BD1-7 clade bacterium]CAA0104267.1 Uncharacterised protein [BD1-7 clade bacterium]
MKKFMFGIFSALFGISANAQIESADWKLDPTETTIGIHLISDYGNGQSLLSKEISNKSIATEINKLDWVSNFYQFIVVLEPGISMEIGGSLNGINGLSAMYRNRHNRINAVINEAPESVLQMQNILEDFILGDDQWKKKYDFDFKAY